MTSDPARDADLAILAPELHRVLTRHVPEYFELSPLDRELRRAVWGSQGSEPIRATLLADVLGKTEKEIEAIKARDEFLSPAEALRINTLMQQIDGIGEDFFSWNEALAEGQTALSLATIGAYDRADHAFQEEAMAEQDPDYAPRPYRGRLSGAWARYLEAGELRYAVISDFASFVLTELESMTFDVISELVPHSYVDGPKHGRTAGDGLVEWDMRLDAGGLEELHDAIWKEANAIIQARADALRDAVWQGERPTVWLFDENAWSPGHGDNGVYVIFSGPQAMDRVRTRHFRTDCAALAGDVDTLRTMVGAETAAYEARLRMKHAELRAAHPQV